MFAFPEALERLAREFVVRDIMVPEADLKWTHDRRQAIQLLDEYPDFDMIPIRTGGVLTTVHERGAAEARPIAVSDLVSDATSIIDVVDILVDRPRVFVLVRDHIGGYVHFSDLNHPTVKLPFFVLLEAVERRFFEALKPRITLEVLEQVLDFARCSTLKDKMSRLTATRANLNWAAQLSFKEILLSARFLGAKGLDVPAIDLLSAVRNRVCHAATDDQLVEDHSHVRRLAQVRNLALELLGTWPLT